MQLFIGKHAADTLLKSRSPCYGAWLSFDHRSELALPIVFSATATEHGCELIAWIDYEDARNLAATKKMIYKHCFLYCLLGFLLVFYMVHLKNIPQTVLAREGILLAL